MLIFYVYYNAVIKIIVIVLLIPRPQADMVAYWKSDSISSMVNTAYVATGNKRKYGKPGF